MVMDENSKLKTNLKYLIYKTWPSINFCTYAQILCLFVEGPLWTYIKCKQIYQYVFLTLNFKKFQNWCIVGKISDQSPHGTTGCFFLNPNRK